ncbi:YggS family pyridoxal phosphate-dependent enzyme [Sediminibacterium sp.]|uniref:YggS family pyridoxal phosphate-dependent enzyme n=1 Tax=Sediminibacterium sp. TaxID=1917865 RepID=UPI0025F5A4B4|nr:YggS family pyridoxal phosphate-dependent enzyme [Sediminibacterium sp.]MBW0178256.1 YggS family pyridoxal phosphate-dependent enzyme [Sediminibacterium sp.]
MGINREMYEQINLELRAKQVTLVAVSKTKPVADIEALYALGQRAFGENYVQELVDKQALLPADIDWHFIGHLQTNKVKYIAPFVHLIHGVDSFKLLKEIDKQAARHNRVINCLLQIHIASEETKFGMDENELKDAMAQLDSFPNVKVCGLMGMASFSDDESKVRGEFKILRDLLNESAISHQPSAILSMGMSGDYKIAIEEGSTMVRIGSLLFGARVYQ